MEGSNPGIRYYTPTLPTPPPPRFTLPIPSCIEKPRDDHILMSRYGAARGIATSPLIPPPLSLLQIPGLPVYFSQTPFIYPFMHLHATLGVVLYTNAVFSPAHAPNHSVDSGLCVRHYAGKLFPGGAGWGGWGTFLGVNTKVIKGVCGRESVFSFRPISYRIDR